MEGNELPSQENKGTLEMGEGDTSKTWGRASAGLRSVTIRECMMKCVCVCS